MAQGDNYSWENRTIDDNFINQLISAPNPVKFLTGGITLGAQQQSNAYELLDKVQKYVDQKIKDSSQQLKAIDPYFDPKRFLVPTANMFRAGEGASSNRSFPIEDAARKIGDQFDALKRTQQAATTYQQTGQFTPPPTDDQIAQILKQRYPQYNYNSADIEYMKKGASAISDEDKEVANAAAVRVGAPLPYPTSNIGEPAPGGIFANAKEAAQYYSPTGQFNNELFTNKPPKAILQSTVNPQMSQAITKNVSGQNNMISDNGDGTYSFGGKSYKNLQFAQAAAQRAGIANPSVSTGTQAISPIGGQTGNFTGNQQSGNQPITQTNDQFHINTGNPEVDNLANTYLDSIWERYSGLIDSLPGEIDEATMQKLAADVEEQYGPALAREKQRVEDTYTQQLNQSQGMNKIANQKLDLGVSRGLEDTTRQTGQIQEDVTKQKRILGRNFQEAMNDTATNFAARNRTFSGDRIASEAKQTQNYKDSLDELDKQSKRQIDQLNLNQSRLGEDSELNRRELSLSQQGTEFGLNQQKELGLQGVAETRANALLQRQQQVESLPWQTIPNFINQPAIANAGIAQTQQSPYQSAQTSQSPYQTTSTVPQPTRVPAQASNVVQGRSYRTPELAQAAQRRLDYMNQFKTS